MCVLAGGSLASALTNEEWLELLEFSTNPEGFFGLPVWMGLEREHMDAPWMWQHGNGSHIMEAQAFVMDDWKQLGPEPAQGPDKLCAALMNGGWLQQRCDEELNYLCRLSPPAMNDKSAIAFVVM